MRNFAMYRLPYATEAYRIDDDSPTLLQSVSDLNGVSGFVMAPFSVSADMPIVVISGQKQKVELVQQSRPSMVDETFDSESYSNDFHRFHSAISSGRFSKLVLSRCAEIVAENSVVSEALFAEACRHYPRMMIALVSSEASGVWLMATPELLIANDGYQWKTMALAGTMAYDGDRNYEWSDKNIAEQKMVADYLWQTLTPLVSDLEESSPYTVRAGNLVHLRSDFFFHIDNNNSQSCNIGNVVDALHPTPAVCGLPKDEAIDFILSNESVDRKYYSGFLGPWNIDGLSSLFVALRCMEIVGNKCILHAGGGLLKASTEDSEWHETMMKMEAMRGLMDD